MASTGIALDDKVVVVLGGTSGIGRALALGMARAGATVVASARRVREVDETAGALEALGRSTLRQCADVTDRGSLLALRDAVTKAFGPVDVLVNCAGVTQKGPTLDFPDADWERIMDCNLTGTLRACQVFGAAMLERGHGRIINIASLSTFAAFFEVAAYGASKAAVGALTKSLAVEWGPRGVTVNAIAPGVFRTELNKDLLDGTPRGLELLLRTPMRRFGQHEELVGAAVFLGSDSASFVNGEILTVDGGFLASAVNQ